MIRIQSIFLPGNAAFARPGIYAALLALFSSSALLRADMTLEQQVSDTNGVQRIISKLHDDKMRLDEPDASISVIVDLGTRNSITLLTTNKTYLRKFGSEVRWEMDEEKKRTHGTNEMDVAPARPVDTGKSSVVNGLGTEIYTWSGAFGLTETLWVATNFPNYDAIQIELLKLDTFNDAGPHRNAQPALAPLPGMVIKSEAVARGRSATTTLISVTTNAVDPAIFEFPEDYSPWKPPENKNN